MLKTTISCNRDLKDVTQLNFWRPRAHITLFYKSGLSPYQEILFKKTSYEIKDPDSTIVFQVKNIEIPESWSQVASDVLAQKYFRKAGVLPALKPVPEKGVPAWLYRSTPDFAALEKLPEDQRFTRETSSKKVFDRLAGTWSYGDGYFSSEEDARTYFDKMCYMLCLQFAALILPNV